MNSKKYKTILQSGVWLILLAVLIVSMGFINQSRKRAKCTGLSIDISIKEGNYFIDEDDIRDFIYQSSGDPIGGFLGKIDLELMEYDLERMDAVSNAEVYSDLKGHIKIDIEQRIPIARIFYKDAKSIYMDDQGEMMSLSSKFTARVIVINGNVPSPYLINTDEKIKDPDWLKLNSLINTIRNDEFLNAQFEQVYINTNNEYELIPRVGRHIILFGKGNDIDKKFRKLKLFYKEGISKVDWNKYKQIDLRFNDQIVCAKR